jgi:hypothetical protein
MFDEKKRREELLDMTDLHSYFIDKHEKAIDIIISQEKLMIAEAKKDAREEFVKELKILKTMDRDFYIDKLLKRYEEL